MREAAVREFNVAPNEYQVFRFSIPRPSTLYINMIATASVDVLLLDNENRSKYEYGDDSYFAFTWGRRTSIDEDVDVEPGTWYIIVEGRDEWSRGRVRVLEQRLATR
jgi:hypothetical protein